MIKLNCPSCGASLKSDQSRCDYCGSEFLKEPREKPPSAEKSAPAENSLSGQSANKGGYTPPPPSGSFNTQYRATGNTPPPSGYYNQFQNNGYPPPQNGNYGGYRGAYTPPPPQRQQQGVKDTYGVTALIMAIIGITMCPILMIVSLVLSKKQLALSRNTPARIARVIAVIGLILWLGGLVAGGSGFLRFLNSFGFN